MSTQDFVKLHWENNGKWSCYAYGDKLRVCHRIPMKVAYFEVDFPENTEDSNIKILCESFVQPWMYVREREVCACVRCGKRGNDVVGRDTFNNADICDRCYNAILEYKEGDSPAEVFYEILPLGIKGKEIKNAG